MIIVKTCFRNSPKGEATLRLQTDDPNSVLASMRRYISLAMHSRQRQRLSGTSTNTSSRGRTESVMTVTGYQSLLDRSQQIPENIPQILETGGTRKIDLFLSFVF